MAFKLSYSFEGNPRSRPVQNISGASHSVTRDNLLQKLHEERQKRSENRKKLQCAELLQSHIRSYLSRKHVKNSERVLFDQGWNTLQIDQLLSKLLFFYSFKQDNDRLNAISNKLLQGNGQILEKIVTDNAFKWLLRRWLAVCLKSLQKTDSLELMLECLDVFSKNPDTIDYLIKRGYFTHFRQLLDTSNDEKILQKTMDLTQRPFQCLHLSESSQDLILSEFCAQFLKPTLTPNVKTHLIPYLKYKKDFPFDRIIRYLNGAYHFEYSISLFYCILFLEPDEFEPTIDSIQVLSNLSSNAYQLKTQQHFIIDDDTDDEEEQLLSEEQILLSDYLLIMNKPEKVKRWLHFFEANSHDEDVLTSFTQLSHNLLLVYKDSIRKYLLLYKLGLNRTFLNKLWQSLIRKKSLEQELKGSCLLSWKDCHSKLSVFCDMFTFYTETLTDRENSDTSETFSSNDLYSMSKLLRSVSIDLVEVAFPMCRASMIPATSEVLHLYHSCLNCLKMLYMLDMRKKFCPLGFWTSRKIHISQDLSRKNYLSKHIQPFYGVISENDDDEHLPPLSTIEQRSLAVLQQLPFLISFNTRVLLLRELCRFSLGENDYLRLHHEFTDPNFVVIRRTHLYEDAFEKLSTKNDSDLKHRVRIQFINSVGLEEAGVDGGGIFKEFINEVLKTAFDPNRGFFLMTADNTLYPNPNVHLIVENFTEHYFFIGRLVGKYTVYVLMLCTLQDVNLKRKLLEKATISKGLAIFENILVDLPLAEFFLAKLLVDRASAHYLMSLDPVLYRNLLYLRDYTGDVTDLGLDFTTVNNDLGETTVMDLKPNGRNISVSNENRLEYIQRLADLKLNTQLKKQCTAFREGLDSVVPLLWLKLFNHNELQVIIGGDTQEIDLDDLRTHTVYGGDFSSDHPTILLFWRLLRSFTDSQRRKLLKFVTSCSRGPLLGFKELNPPFGIHSSGTEDRMPTASTCLNLLKLPIIQDEEILKNKLLSAIEQQAGFELS